MSIRLDGAVISDEALVAIVRGAVSQVDGVRLDRPGRVSRVLPGRRDAVSWELADGGAAFDVDVAASYGVPLPRAAADVRREVATAVVTMTGLPVSSVDVTVTGVER
ncbi:MAG TPA: Asp23/Gls24 family envelope stress response protein [Gaiellales bacterium]|nr:Asp23/Gls24 family envelope stress response protein [Gaiellales bacterium]